MSPVDQALQTLLGWCQAAFWAFMTLFGWIEGYLREFLLQLGTPERLQGPFILVAAVVFIVVVLRLFGGLFRIVLLVFLILLILHVLAPVLGI